MTTAATCPRCGMPQTPGVPCHACAGPVASLTPRVRAAHPGEKKTPKPFVKIAMKRQSGRAGGRIALRGAGVGGSALRGAIGFGLGAGIASLSVASIVLFDFFAGIGHLGQLSLLVAGSAMSGACGGAILGWKRNIPGSSVIAALGFGLGFTLPGWLFPLTLRGLHEVGFFGTPSERALYGALLWGGVLGLAGAIGAAPLRSALGVTGRHALAFTVLAGALAFGIGGAVGGTVVLAYSLPSDSFHYWPFFTALFIAYTIGGTLLGTAVGFKAKRLSSRQSQGVRGEKCG